MPDKKCPHTERADNVSPNTSLQKMLVLDAFTDSWDNLHVLKEFLHRAVDEREDKYEQTGPANFSRRSTAKRGSPSSRCSSRQGEAQRPVSLLYGLDYRNAEVRCDGWRMWGDNND